MNYSQFETYMLERLRNELPENLYYHNYEHTVQVRDSVILLAGKSNISQEETQLLKTAALCHDFGFTKRYYNNECVAAGEVTVFLPDFNYTKEQIAQISKMIQATCIPQTPTNEFEEIICDADLFYLGTDSFEKGSISLRKELKNYGTEFSDIEWCEFQIDFMLKHHFFTSYGKSVLKPVKLKHIESLQQTLAKLKSNMRGEC